MNKVTDWAAFAHRHRTPVTLLALMPVLANAIALSGFFNTDPTLAFIGLAQGVSGGWISGQMGWVDPSVAYVTQPDGYLAASDWLHGIVPWWNPYAGIGMPLAAEMQASAFFLPFVFLLHFCNGWLLLRTVLQICCGLFTYALLIEIGLTRTASLLGGALYALTPMFMLSPCAAIAPLPFLPLLLLGIERTAASATQNKPMGWSLVVVAVAYSFYAGFPEITYLNGLFAGGWAVWRLAVLPAAARLRFAGKLGLALALAICLCAPLLIPFLEYLRVAYVSGHGSLFQHIPVFPAIVPLQIFPSLYGSFPSPPPPQLVAGFQYCYRLPGWVSLPVLALALAALWRPGERRSLKFFLLFWVVLWEARYVNAAPVLWLMDAIPGLAATDSSRLSGPAVNLAVFALAAMGFDDYRRLPPMKPARLGGIALSLAGIVLAAILPVLGFILTWYALRPSDMHIALAAFVLDGAVLLCLGLELRRPRYRHALVALLLAGPLLGFMLPQLAGLRSGSIDTAPIRFLQSHTGTSRMLSLGPLGSNFANPYRIASVNFVSVPVPQLWAGYTVHLAPTMANATLFSATPEALLNHEQAYEAIGTRFVIASPADNLQGYAFSAVDPQHINANIPLVPGGPAVQGAMVFKPDAPAISAMSVIAGTYYDTSHGPVTGTLCDAGSCAAATVDAASAADNTPLLFSFATPLKVQPGDHLTYRFTQSTGKGLALWLAPNQQGVETLTVSLFVQTTAAQPVLVFHDRLASIFELPNPAPYAQTSDASCNVAIAGRQTIQTLCANAAILTRRELFFPGWAATVNGQAVPISQSGLFQTVPVPAGTAVVRFSYAPEHIRAACALALLALALWLGLAFRRRFY